MGRIKKAAGPKHEATVSPAITDFVNRVSTLPLSHLPQLLRSFPLRWPLPRGDLYHWIPLLNRFDNTLESFIREYGLDNGPQTQAFTCRLLASGVAEENAIATVTQSSAEDLTALGFSADGDRQLVENILQFSKSLLENCGNRSLYNSSERLGALLNTTSLSLLSTTLQLAVRLAQRFHASRQRGAHASQNLNNALLASHYNIDLEKVQKLANPFIKLPSSPDVSTQLLTPTAKGKEKAHPSSKGSAAVNANDLLALAQDTRPLANGSAKHDHSAALADPPASWQEWAGVHLTYYQRTTSANDESPSTPTPTRRNSSLSRPSRLSSSDETPDPASPAATNGMPEEANVAGMQQLEISQTDIASYSPEEILSNTLEDLPKESRYDLLSRVRVAHAVTKSPQTRQDIVGIRLLAITNLAYIYAEQLFESKILKQDSDEPHNLQLVHQLSELIHPPGNGSSTISMKLQTLAIGTLEALLKHKAKAAEVSAALSINVNHGVLFYILRKAVADMAEDDAEQIDAQREEWREAVFSLLDTLPTSAPRTGETLVAAGLLDILIEVLNLRTKKAERNHPRVLAFLNSFIYTVRDAFQTLANNKGLETISDLIAYEVESSIERAKQGEGLPQEFRTLVIDYQIPFAQQQTLRMLFKIINHMMTHNSGNFDRLLRNLIDSPKLLSGLHTVIINTRVFGSSVWSGAVNIMSSFIHNEPTSYAVISEAGLSRGFLEAISSMPLDMEKEIPEPTPTDAATEESATERPTTEQSTSTEPSANTDSATNTKNALPDPSADTMTLMKFFLEEGHQFSRPEDYILAQGILPATDAIVTVPQAFGAICLNHSGMDMFQKSQALDKFFEIFESPEHVKSMGSEMELARLLGSSFDELVRHHPNLKMLVMSAILKMIGRVKNLCSSRGIASGQGAKLWLQDDEGRLVQAGKERSTGTVAEQEEDIVMTEAFQENSQRATVSDSLTQSFQQSKSSEDGADHKKLPGTSTFIEVALKFLSGFFENATLCSLFVDSGGADRILELATLPTLPYDFNGDPASAEIAKVVHMLAEQKPHLVLPLLLQCMEAALNNLEPLYECSSMDGFFSEFTSPTLGKGKGVAQVSNAAIGSTIVQSLVHVHTLCNVLYEVFSPPIFNSRSSQSPFSLVNLTDMYTRVIKSLGLLHRVCVWEEILLQKRLPESWKEATRIKGYGMGSQEADEVFGFIPEEANNSPHGTAGVDSNAVNGTLNGARPKKARKPSVANDEKTAPFKNVQTLRFLLSQIPSAIVPFFQGLGKVLVGKRRVHSHDYYQRQNACMIAEAMSGATLEQLNFEAPQNAAPKDRHAYWIVILTSLSQLMVEGSIERPHSQVLTLVLQAFENDGGLDAIKKILDIFYDETVSLHKAPDTPDNKARSVTAYGGMKIILSFYTHITASKTIIDASQSHAMASAETRPGHAHYFSPSQFLVELRMAVLPVVKSLWDSDFADKANGSIVKCLINILKTVLEGADEQHAFKKGNDYPIREKELHRGYDISAEKLQTLMQKGFQNDLAQEALYRCLNVQATALAYCQRLKALHPEATRLPIPDYDRPKQRKTVLEPSTPSHNRRGSSRSTPGNETSSNPDASGGETPAAAPELDMLTPAEPLLSDSDVNALIEVEEADGEESDWQPPAPGVPPELSDDAQEGMAMSVDNLQSVLPPPVGEEALPISPLIVPGSSVQPIRSGGPSLSGKRTAETSSNLSAPVTLEELDAARSVVRSNLIDRALDVLNVHDDVIFELADLISAATLKASDAKAMRGEIGATLMQSLISFQMEEDFRSAGKKIAAYANLLALVLQDRDFYEAALSELKESFEALLGFIKIFPDQPPEESSPWIGRTLLVIEKILAEDVQPAQIQWTAPGTEVPSMEDSMVQLPPPLVSNEVKDSLLNALLELMPRIGKDESLVLSVVRTLVILTRNRSIASRLGEKRNIQRLFVMIKQLSGMTNERLPGCFMLLLRHVVEDDEIVRQIMRSEIKANFETRPSRPTDTTGYVRQMYHLVLRSPEIFVEVTNQELEVGRYDTAQRPQILALKKKTPTPEAPADETPKIGTSGTEEVEGKTTQEKEPSGEEMQTASQVLKAESKAPVVERPSGVIHYLLNELLSYKDVEDKDAIVPPKQIANASSTELSSDMNTADGSQTGSSTPSAPANASDAPTSKKPEKFEFKAEQHPIYMYRCFILQCLTELLQSYNQAKVEFINFSRKAEAKATTPSKPRSGLLNYLLNDLIPVGTLRTDESTAYRKKNNTSNWAMSTIVALCLKTNEYGYDHKPGSLDEDEQQDLIFVRRFVLEHALKAYKDANASEEYPDVKYARLLDIADLFNRLLTGKIVSTTSAMQSVPENGAQRAIAKLMFEKNFIAALTGSIADIDLNFPGSPRAIKYILRPLKLLTATAVTLSETSSISTAPGLTAEEDEISSATSVSEANDEREETPDLFRNSTLGMFEPGREEESSSGDSEAEDDEMYDEEYEEGMDFEDEMERDGEDVISDEDEDLGEAGHMEGLHGDTGMDVEVMIEEDDDDEDDEDDDDEGSEDDEDDDPDDSADEEIEVIDEINGDDENASLAAGEEEEWQDEMEEQEANDDGDLVDDILRNNGPFDTAPRDNDPDFGGPEAILQRLEGLEDGPSDLIMDIENDRYMEEVVRHEDEEDDQDDEDEGDDIVEEEVIYQPDYEDDEPGTPDLPYWHDPEDEPFPHDHHHHHHHRHIRRMPVPDPWSLFPNGGPPTHRGHMPLYRSHRPTGGPRPTDDGTNPLLQRSDRPSQAGSPRGGRSALSDANSLSDYWVHGMEEGPTRGIMAESPVSFVNNLIAAIGQGNPMLTTTGGPDGAVHLQINGDPRDGVQLPRELQAVLGFRHRHRDPHGMPSTTQSSQQVPFVPAQTYQRWQEEARLLFANGYHDKAARIVNSLLRVLVPPALEKRKRQEEEMKRMEEQAAKLREQERVQREEKEKKEREQREQEEREAAAAAAVEAEAQPETGNEAPAGQAEDGERPLNAEDGAMEGVETTESTQPAESEDQSEEQADEAGPSQPAERVRVEFQGQQLDITDMGIDEAYLDALPEELRNEVILSQIAMQRSQAATAGAPPTDIDEEFLGALPPEIRAELLQQETQERRRREREEARRQQAATGGGPPLAEEMDPASFLASLDPTLRQHVLMEQDEEMLAHLPEEIAAEARALGGDRSMHRFAGMPGRAPRSSVLPRHLLDRLEAPQHPAKKPPRKQIVQMLDKAGVATLLRLMFIPQHGTARGSLHNILNDVAQNRQTRAEVISLLLSILQDGSTDVNAVERSFTQLSLRAKQPVAPKTPQLVKRTGTFTGQMASVANNFDATPLMVIQQCLSALVAMTQFNDHIPSFFLTEHEVSSGMKSKANRKGKNKETKASKFALNALLSLLGRKLIMESSTCMEQLASLLQRVTQPLTILLKKEKEPAEEPKAVEAPADQPPVSNRDAAIAQRITEIRGQLGSQVQIAGTTTQDAVIPDAAAQDSTTPMADVQTTNSTEGLPTEGQTTTGASESGPVEAQPNEPKKSASEDKKKPRTLVPPIVPEENLRLVVNILAARECSAKTFRDTLSTINNLSAIPEAKEIFGKGLIEQAQDLGQSILNDLDELVPQIKQAENGTDLQGMALSKFSPASSDQAKLLRILTALDYLFDPKRTGGKKTAEGHKEEALSSNADLLTSLYENSTFGPLWDKLSECLSAIRQGDGMLNIATILLPLVEALMVVCKNTTLKDAPLIKATKEFAVTSPAPESRMESLFFNFTEEHRKILNDLVRHNPKLMSGTFSLLVKNPKVLDFDNKRNYFTRRVHSRGTEARHPQPPLQLPVRRDQVFLDSFKWLSFKTGDEIKYGKLSIRFNGEEGVDAGGVTREWFQVLSRQMFNPDYALFIPVASDRTTFHPNKLSKVNDEHLMFFKFIGRIIGKALYEGRALDCHFSRAVYKRILGKTVSIKDMETLDLDYYKSLIWMLENDITEIITETMSIETDDFGVAEIVDLVPNGRNIPVTEDNKQEYVQLVVEYRLTGSVQAQLEKFLEGFHDIVPPELISIFNEQELELLISGLPDIDVDDWKAHTDYHNYQAASPQIQWFWRAVRSFDKEERAKLLQFVTGTSKVPLNGFGQLEGMNGFSRFNIHRDYGNKDRLPSSHTCFNQLDLPEYDSYEALRHQVYTAMTAGSEYFGFA